MLEGRKIQRLRERAGYSRPELARITGVDRRTIALAEQGFRAPRFSTLRALAEGLDCAVADFFNDAHPDPEGRGYPAMGYEDQAPDGPPTTTKA